MSKQIEALKLALETSEGIVNADWRKWDELASPSEFERWAKSRANFMATILREALAKSLRDVEQPAHQEPVAWMWRCKPYCGWPEWSVSLKRPADSGRDGHKRTEGYEDVPLYTSPPASKPWQGLTDEEMHACWDSPLTPLGMKHARMIEAKLKEKNT